MPLELNEPKFDRSFEEIYRELRSRIPRYNREWTNFNESDPGITLLQLFAWLADMTLHRMNAVPRKNYLKFAELLGMQLRAARPARVRLSFTAKAAEPPATIRAGSRYAGQVEGSPPVVFETTQDLDVIGAPLAAMLVYADGGVVKVPPPTIPPTQPFHPLGRNPELGDALYLGFKPNPNNPNPFPAKMRFLVLRPEATTAGAAQRAGEPGRDSLAPVTLVWEFRPKRLQDFWQPLDVFADETAAFTRDGYVDVEGPSDIEPSIDAAVQALVPEPHYWFRVRLEQNTYANGRAPRLEFFLPNAVDAVSLVTEKDERVLGDSDGSAGQAFVLPDRPIEPDSLVIEVREGVKTAAWKRKDDFFSSDDRATDFVLDATSGRIAFGDGKLGDIPPAGAQIVAKTWRHGGGSVGNRVAPGAVKTMVTQVAGIEKVTNVRPAAGGADEESIDAFLGSAPARLRHAGRVVTARDFETTAENIDGVAKARALGGRHPDYPGVDVPGAVTVHIVPDSDALKPLPSAELIDAVCRVFDDVRLITTEVFVAAPRFLEVRIEARLFAAPESAFDRVAADARQRLNEFLDPRRRAFGENVSPAAIYARLFGSPDDKTQVRSVEDLLIYVDGRPHEEGKPIAVPPDALVFPGDHLIVVRPDQDDASRR